jgi:TonB family protein
MGMKILNTTLFSILFLCFTINAQDGVLKSYYPDGKLESEINFKNNIREGEAKFYYPSGNLEEERFYFNGKIEGLVKIYHENGKLKELRNIESGKVEGSITLFSEEGEYITDIYFQEGKRIIETSPFSEESFREESEKPTAAVAEEKKAVGTDKPAVEKNKSANSSLLPPSIEEERFENDPAFYLTVEVMPEPVGGMETIYKKLVYPETAKDKGIEGTVIIKTFIDEYGEVTNAEVEKGIGGGCDEAARLAVYYTKFKPGMQRGRPVRVQMQIPVEFKLLK